MADKKPFERLPDEELNLTPDQAVKLFRRMRRVVFHLHVMTFATMPDDPRKGYRACGSVQLSCADAIKFVKDAWDRKQFREEDVRVPVHIKHPSYDGGTTLVFIGSFC